MDERFWIMAEEKEEEMIITPWEISGKINYNKLTQQFGTRPLTEELRKK